MDYSTAESGGSYSANNCTDVRYNGVGGCSNTTTNSSCAYSPLSVRCERGGYDGVDFVCVWVHCLLFQNAEIMVTFVYNKLPPQTMTMELHQCLVYCNSARAALGVQCVKITSLTLT